MHGARLNGRRQLRLANVAALNFLADLIQVYRGASGAGHRCTIHRHAELHIASEFPAIVADVQGTEQLAAVHCTLVGTVVVAGHLRACIRAAAIICT